MKEVYLHIGMHKTGTSYIQKSLRNNEELLNKNKIGYLYFNDSPISNCASHKLAWGLGFGMVPDLGTKEKNARLLGECKKQSLNDFDLMIQNNSCEKLIVSSELFCEGMVENDYSIQINNLYNKLINCQTKIIIYIRKYDDYFESLYSEVIKGTNYSKPIDKFVEEQLIRTKKDVTNFIILPIINQWNKAFGKENIIVKVYSKDKFKNKDLFADFLETCNIYNFDYEETRQENSRISGEILEIKKNYNQMIYEENTNMINYNILDLLYKYCSKISQYSKKSYFNTLTKELRTKIYTAFEPECRIIEENYSKELSLIPDLEQDENQDEYTDTYLTNSFLAKWIITLIQDLNLFQKNYNKEQLLNNKLFFQLSNNILFSLDKNKNIQEIIKNSFNCKILYSSQNYLKVIPTNTDPSFIINLDSENKLTYIIKVNIEASSCGLFSIFYKFSRNEEYSEKSSLHFNLKKGSNIIHIRLPENINKMVRIDPSDNGYPTIIHDLTIKSL